MSEFGDWPPELLARVIKSMAPERVCRTCGEPQRPIREHLGRERYKQPPTPEEFAVAMRDAMAASGKTVEDIAGHLSVTPWMIRHYRGETPTPQLPSLKRWNQLTQILTFSDTLVESMSVVDRSYDTPDRGNRQVKERLSGGAISGDLPKVVQTGRSDCGHPCPTCNGSGLLGHYEHIDQGTGEHLGNQPIPCDVCGGSGRPWRPGVVLDPFGMGGTAEVAQALGRDGIEILESEEL